MSTSLEREFQYYLEHQNELVEKYNGKFVVIKGENVIGAYDTEAEAFLQTKAAHDVGTFLIQRCSPGDSDYTQHFQSRVAFG